MVEVFAAVAALASIAAMIGLRVRTSRRDRTRLDEVDRLLGLAIDPHNVQISMGELDGFSVVLAPAGHALPCVALSVTGIAHPIAEMSVHSKQIERRTFYWRAFPGEQTAADIAQSVPAELREPKEGRERDVETGDTAFDRRATVAGEESEVFALLDAGVRERLVHAMDRFNVELDDATLHAAFTLDSSSTAEQIAAWVRDMLRLARMLEHVGAAARPARLHTNALAEYDDVHVRARNLDILLEHFADSEEAQAARTYARGRDEPELLLVLATRGDEARLSLLERIAANEQAPEETRSFALFELAATEPVRSLDTFAAALGSDSDIVQVAAVGGLNMVDLGVTPLATLLDRLDELGPNAYAAALAMLGRVSDEGAVLDEPLRVRVIETLIERGALDHAESGALGIVGEEPKSGALSLEDRSGAVSVHKNRDES